MKFTISKTPEPTVTKIRMGDYITTSTLVKIHDKSITRLFIHLFINFEAQHVQNTRVIRKNLVSNSMAVTGHKNSANVMSHKMPRSQSAYRQFHSTETVVTPVYNDMLVAADGGQVSVLCLLDLSAAFDTVDHTLLTLRLER